MTGYNLATYRSWMLRRLEGAGGPEGSYNLPDSALFAALNEAQRQVQEEFGLLQKLLLNVATVADQRPYELDPTLHGRRILGMWFRSSATADYHSIDRIPYARALEDGLIQAAATGTPESWCVDEATAGRFLLLPTPNVSLASALQVHIEASPRALSAIYDSTGLAMANLTFGSDQVIATNMGGTPAANPSVVAGHEFGLLTTDRNGNADLPARWYEIESVAVDGYTVTLRETYAGATVTGAAFLTAQRSDLEAAHPGKLGFALADLACASIREDDAPEQAAVWRAGARAVLDRLRRDEQGTAPRGRRTTVGTPFFNR